MMYRGYGMFGGGGIFGILIFAIGIYFVIKYLNKNNNGPDMFRKKDAAIDLLNERYVKGEIDEEEYKKMKNMLNG
jgi:putative membrane protein